LATSTAGILDRYRERGGEDSFDEFDLDLGGSASLEQRIQEGPTAMHQDAIHDDIFLDDLDFEHQPDKGKGGGSGCL